MAITDFHLLLLDEDPARRASLQTAAERAGVTRLNALQNPQEARGYFEELTRRDGRLPSLLLLGLDDPSGIEFLSWLKSRPELRRMVTVGVVAPGDGRWIGRAYDLTVNSCVMRPEAPDDQVRFFQSIRRYWEQLNEAPPR